MKMESCAWVVVLLVLAVLMPANVESREEEKVKDGFLYVHHPSAVPLLATYVINASRGDGIAFFGTRNASDSTDFGAMSVTSLRVSMDGTVIQFLLDPDTGSLKAVMDDDGEYFFWLSDLIDETPDSATEDNGSFTCPPTYKPSFSPSKNTPFPAPTARPSRHASTTTSSYAPSIRPTTLPTAASGSNGEFPKKKKKNVYKKANMKSKAKQKSSSAGNSKKSKKNNDRNLQGEMTSREVYYRIDTSWCGPPPKKGVFVREKYRITQFAIDTPVSIFYGVFLDPKKQAYVHRNIVGPEKFEKTGKHTFQARTDIDLPYFAPPALDPENFEEALVYATCQLVKIVGLSILGGFTTGSCILLGLPSLVAACIAVVPIILELGSNLWDCNEFAGYDGGRFNIEFSRTVHAEAHIDFGNQDRIKYKVEHTYAWKDEAKLYGLPYPIKWESELDDILKNGEPPFGQWKWVLDWPLGFEAVDNEKCNAGSVAGLGGVSSDENEIEVNGCQVVWGNADTPIDLPEGGTDGFVKKNLSGSSIDGFSTYFDVYVKVESPRDIKVKDVMTFVDTQPFSSCIVTWNYAGSR